MGPMRATGSSAQVLVIIWYAIVVSKPCVNPEGSHVLTWGGGSSSDVGKTSPPDVVGFDISYHIMRKDWLRAKRETERKRTKERAREREIHRSKQPESHH